MGLAARPARKNFAKRKFLAGGKRASEKVSASGIVPVVFTLRVLGVDFCTRINGKDRPASAKKASSGSKSKTRCSPSPHLRPQVRAPETACHDLVAILQGRSLDLQFMARSQTVSMWARLFQQGYANVAARAIQGTWQYAAWQHLKDLGRLLWTLDAQRPLEGKDQLAQASAENCSTEGAWPETICDVSSEQLGESAVMDRDVRDFDLLRNSVQQEGECFHVGALTTCALPSVWGFGPLGNVVPKTWPQRKCC